MRKRRKNDLGKAWRIVLSGVILCCWLSGSIMVYGFDVSGTENFDTGGFDMDVGEGTGQLPENWEDPVSREQEENQGNDSANSDDGSQGSSDLDYSASDFVTEGTESDTEGGSQGESWVENNDQDSGIRETQSETAYSSGNEDTTGTNIFQESNTESGELAEIPDSTHTENTEIIPTATATSVPVQSPKANPKPSQTSAPSPTATPKPTKTERAKKNADSAKEKSVRGLSYYQKEKTEDSPEKAETQKEIKPSFLCEIHNNEIHLEIREDIPFQILSFRVQGKEIIFHWQGKKLLAEVPRGTGKIEKVEILGFVKSGRLYHEIVDLTEKQ